MGCAWGGGVIFSFAGRKEREREREKRRKIFFFPQNASCEETECSKLNTRCCSLDTGPIS